jgi:acyl-coenzyme A thioesterase PaaI-like protein
MATITVDQRFCGPPGFANGGYLAGLMAQHSPTRVRIRLERPIPLRVPLELNAVDGGGLELTHLGAVLARALPAELELEVPVAPSYLEALEASRHFVGFAHHLYPACFVCGTERLRGDGLRIFAGRHGPGDLVAAPWVADAALSDGDGKVRPEFISAALDCPGVFASRTDLVPMLLGEFTAHIDRRVHIEEPCVVIGWKIRANGRKFEVGTALFDEDGELCARARAVWIELKPAQ